MSKEILKATLAEKQGNKLIKGQAVPSDYALTDTHRLQHKADGGTYNVIENVELISPRDHMETHGNLRVRDEWGTRLKALMDDRSQALKLQLKINNQLLAFKRGTDDYNPETAEILESMLVPPTTWLREIDKQVTKHLKTSDDPLVKCLLNVPGCGPVTTAYLLVYVDLEKAKSPSALWKYVGLHCSSSERYTKGVKGGGNKTLRTVLYNTACSMMKSKTNPYREVYDTTKAKLAVSDKLVKTYTTKGRADDAKGIAENESKFVEIDGEEVLVRKGKQVEKAWKDVAPGHRHGAALRAIIKHFLADFWMIGRRARGLPERTLYAEQILHHDGIIKPESRGWKL